MNSQHKENHLCFLCFIKKRNCYEMHLTMYYIYKSSYYSATIFFMQGSLLLSS